MTTTETATLVKQVLKQEITPDDFYKAHHEQTPRILSVLVNTVCNLQCKHCYFPFNETPQNLDLKVLEQTVARMSDLLAVSLTGKEPLLHPKFPEILKFLDNNRKQNGTWFGFITNATLIPNHIDAITAAQPDFIDISIDGTAEYHDKIRGQGNHAKAIKGLQLLKDHGLFDSSLITVGMTTNTINHSNLEENLQELYNLGVRNFSVSIIWPTEARNQAIELNQTQFDDLIQRLLKLNLPGSTVYNDICTNNQLMAVINSKYNNPDLLKRDKQGIFYYKLMNEPQKIYIRFECFDFIGEWRLNAYGKLMSTFKQN